MSRITCKGARLPKPEKRLTQERRALANAFETNEIGRRSLALPVAGGDRMENRLFHSRLSLVIGSAAHRSQECPPLILAGSQKCWYYWSVIDAVICCLYEHRLHPLNHMHSADSRKISGMCLSIILVTVV